MIKSYVGVMNSALTAKSVLTYLSMRTCDLKLDARAITTALQTVKKTDMDKRTGAMMERFLSVGGGCVLPPGSVPPHSSCVSVH